MGYLANEVISACELITCECEILNAEKSAQVRADVEAAFASEGSSPLWSRLNLYSGIYNHDGWKLIENYTNKQPILLFFEPHLDRSIIFLPDGSELSRILGECSGFVFYITNWAYDFLICFNDHDALIGAGKARGWVEHLVNELYNNLDH